jgi:twitching motility two-component system response regulator PilH
LSGVISAHRQKSSADKWTAENVADRVVLVGERGVISGAVRPHLGYAFSVVQHPIAKDSRVLKTTALIMVLTGALVAPCVCGQDDFGDDESLQADDQSNDEAEESDSDTDTDESSDETDVDDSAAYEASADESDDMADAEDSDDQSNDEAEESDSDTDTDESSDETDVDDSTADEAPPPPPPPPPPPAAERVTSAKVLVVDDSPAELAKLVGLLKDQGLDVRNASSGTEALETTRTFAPDLIFLDTVMPDMDGHEVIRRLRADPKTKAIPVWFVSSKSQKADRIWAAMNGAKGVIGKPWEAAEVLNVLRGQ